jgi:hypothetical protein
LLKYFWEGFNPENNFFTNLLRKKYDVIISENPDYLFYSVYPKIKISKDLSKKGDFIRKISPKLYILLAKIYSRIINFSIKDKFPLPEGNFTKIFFGSELIKPNMNECDWAFSEYPEEEINDPRHMKLIIIVNDYQLKNFGIPPIKKKIDFNKIKKEKNKFCNFIYARDIAERNNFFKELSKYKKIDAPGRCMNNMPPINYNSPKESRISATCVTDKLNFIKNYKFTIAFENSSRSGYISEKLTHPMLVNSIPIYFGHRDVNKEFNTRSFLNYHDFKDMKEFIKYIIKVDKDDKLYEKILKEQWYKDNKPPKELDIKRIQNRLNEIIESKK